MNWCRDCKYALWQKTASGRRHPKGEGQCGYTPKLPTLPSAFHWFMGREPGWSHPWINWKKPYEKCPTFQPIEQ